MAGGGGAQLAEGAGERGESVGVGGGPVAAEQPVQGGTGCEVLQDEDPGGRVGGEDARGDGETEVVGEEPERGLLGAGRG
ncbi:hypothetical protein ACIO3O_32735 [Streptomyces sp. NPDC087440]|uniref:hypothetical protein n=1 Tax=Streptomyces sp. NPDC087440 TaxID=3365790 RepID=UPI0037F1F321